MIAFGATGLLVLAVYFLFLTESGWLRIIGGLYLGFFFVIAVIDALQSTEPLQHLFVPGLIGVLMYFAYTIRSKWKNWP